MFILVNLPKVTILSSTSVTAVSVTELPVLHVIEWSCNIEFCGNNPVFREESCVLLAHSVSLSLYTNVTISVLLQQC